MRKDWHLSNVSENKTMKLDAVLKSIDEAIRCVESARYFSQSDKPETAQERCSEAKGNLLATKRYLEAEIANEST